MGYASESKQMLTNDRMPLTSVNDGWTCQSTGPQNSQEIHHNQDTNCDQKQFLNREWLCEEDSSKAKSWEEKEELYQRLVTQLKKSLDNQNALKATLSKTIKERDFLQLKCQKLEQQVAILESTQKARQDELGKQSTRSKTDSHLRKLGLTEDILLALPFGYATKVKSSFEKLNYENEKLTLENKTLRETQFAASVNAEYEALKNNVDVLTKDKNELQINLDKQIDKNRLTLRTLEDAQLQILRFTTTNNAMHQMLVLMAKELDQFRRKSRRKSQTSEKQGLPVEALRMRCNLLSQINTSSMLFGNIDNNESCKFDIPKTQ